MATCGPPILGHRALNMYVKDLTAPTPPVRYNSVCKAGESHE